jgi:UDP-N-acetylglucosamine--N-acetylmuramyl-(pentapeptide) pyrophosphoryl-undecaprenol N-acetylglucosamine transferase
MKIIFSGGGTGGSVTPLIAIYQEIKKNQPGAEFLWLSPKHDPIKNLILSYGLEVKEISAGKLRRYFSFENLTDLFRIKLGFCQSLLIVGKFRPDYVVSAGGFVSVPVAWAAWLLGKKVLVHQQDIIPGLANKLMAPFAKKITVAFDKSLDDFNRQKTVLTGNPVRAEIFLGSRESAIKYFNLDPQVKTLLIIGGGTGALTLNRLVFDSLPALVGICQVIHLTGGKFDRDFSHPRYHRFDFLNEPLKDALAAADLVVSRAGLGVLTELAALKKPVLIIPMPDSHQEYNAQEFFRNNAAALLSEKGLTAEGLVQAIKILLNDQPQLDNYRRNIGQVLGTKGAENIAAIIYDRAK